MNKYDVVIIGGGISGLTALHYLKQSDNNLSVRLYEADRRLGGTIRTDQIDSYSLDWGPNGFLDREPLTLKLCDELGLMPKLERAGENVSKRYILRKGRLRQVPMSPPKFLLSDILSLKGRLRVLMEPLISARKDDSDESIYDFVKRRIGREAADYLVQPMVSGVYGGIAKKLSLVSCFPIMKEMESEHGSLFKAMIARGKKGNKEKEGAGGPSGPAGWLTSFEGGLYVIIQRMTELYDQFISVGVAVESIRRENSKYVISLADGQKTEAGNVILALPTYRAADIVKELSSELSQSFKEIKYAPIAVVCLGFRRNAIKQAPDGFGFLVPQLENRKILGSIWTSSIFKNRAPNGSVQLRTMVGGDGDHESQKLSDDELTSLVISDLDSILGIKDEPEMIKIYRWSRGIPQYLIGHSKIVQKVENEMKKLGDIYITGNALHGIGLNDCVKQSYKIVNEF